MNLTSPTSGSDRAVPLAAIVLLALAVHGPLLLLQLHNNSYDANTHMFFSAQYARDWFNPWNERWFAGFSQTTHPPLTHQWIALANKIGMTLTMAYTVVQALGLLLLPVGMYRYARLWVGERAAQYAAIGSIFLGSLAMIVYYSGQINTQIGAALALNAVPYFYGWMRDARFSSLLKGLFITVAAAAVHHLTLVTLVLLAAPLVWLALLDRREAGASSPGVLSRGAVFCALAALGIGVVLLPFWIALLQNPVRQLALSDASRENYFVNLHAGLSFWLIPYGVLALALPYIFLRGFGSRRLRPLFLGWWVALMLGLGGTTPVAEFLLGRWFHVFTFERFTFISTLMALPIAGLLCAELIERFKQPALVSLWIVAVGWFAVAVTWINFHPAHDKNFDVNEIAYFLNRDDHNRYRYITLGFGNQFPLVATYADASSVDGAYTAGRQLPEMASYGAAKLDGAKYYGVSGMEALRAVLKHASYYGLKYIFVKDRYYEPMLAFAGWRPVERYQNADAVLWTKEDVLPARRVDAGFVPPSWHGTLWGLLPMASSIIAILLVVVFPERRRLRETLEFPAAAGDAVYLREAK